ncbi:hypothetical protein [Homoserinimonas sp. A520]
MDSVSDLAGSFTCDELYMLEDDMYFYDRMKGFDCFEDGEVALLFRAYQNSESPGQTLEMLLGVVTEDLRLITDANWVAVGTQENLRTIQGLAGASTQDSGALPAAVPLSERQYALNFCVVTGSTITVSLLDQTPVVDSSETYPGLLSVAEAVTDRIKKSDLPAHQRTVYGLSQFGSPIKNYCEEIFPLAG